MVEGSLNLMEILFPVFTTCWWRTFSIKFQDCEVNTSLFVCLSIGNLTVRELRLQKVRIWCRSASLLYYFKTRSQKQGH